MKKIPWFPWWELNQVTVSLVGVEPGFLGLTILKKIKKIYEKNSLVSLVGV
jgi:hypothetical protein